VSEASEAAYEKLTTEVKAQVTAMWKDLRGEEKSVEAESATPALSQTES
jgi:hypothetical protein